MDATDTVKTLSNAVPGVSPLACAQCGQPFTPRPRGRNGRFCRSTCRARWHQAQRTAMLGELEHVLTRAAALVRELRDGSAKLTG